MRHYANFMVRVNHHDMNVLHIIDKGSEKPIQGLCAPNLLNNCILIYGGGASIECVHKSYMHMGGLILVKRKTKNTCENQIKRKKDNNNT